MSNDLILFFNLISAPVLNQTDATATLQLTPLIHSGVPVPVGTPVIVSGTDETGASLQNLPQNVVVSSDQKINITTTQKRGASLIFSISLIANGQIRSGNIPIFWPILEKISLVRPIINFMMNEPNVIDNSVLSAYTEAGGLSFLISEYGNSEPGDKIYLFMNGSLSGVHSITADQIFPIEMIIPTENFNYTGIADIYYEAVDKFNNSSISEHILLGVDRPGKFPDPFQPPNNGLAAPTPVPNPYLLAQFSAMQSMSVTGTYSDMQVGDIIQLAFDLKGKTANFLGEYYKVASAILDITQTHVSSKKFEFTIDHKSFSNIDGNIGHIYYSVYRENMASEPENDPTRQTQSQRTPITIDVVRPFLMT